VVEWMLAWLPSCRGLPVLYEKKAHNYLGLFRLACGLIRFRRYLPLTDSK
jgi:hypothetical protein